MSNKRYLTSRRNGQSVIIRLGGRILFKKHLVLHPFLLALTPIFALLFANIEEASFREAVIPSAISVTATLIVYFGLKFVLKSRVKAGLMTSLAVFIFFAYGRAISAISNVQVLGIDVGRHRYLLVLYIAVLITTLIWLRRTDKELTDLSRVMNVFAASWFTIALLQIGYADLNQHILKLQVKDIVRNDLSAGTVSFRPGEKPDIYYLIFDRYSGGPALKKYLDFDNSDFTDYLEDKGFYVASDSQSNYTVSQQSISSSLSFMYHEDNVSDSIFYEMLQDYRVWRFLKSQGYTFYHFGSWWATIKENRFADYNFPYEASTPQGSFTSMLLRTTVAVLLDYDPNSEAAPSGNAALHVKLRRALLKKFNRLGSIPQEKKPKFVFAHMLIPHEPYLFDERGEPLDWREAEKISEEENYTKYITFANEKIKTLVDDIISNSKSPPIIIIQADEGFTPSRRFIEEGSYGNQPLWADRSSKDLKLHLNILNAYYLPGFDESKLYKSISPVNSFRLVFNHYFGTKYPLLEDKSFLFDVEKKKLIDITDKGQ